MTDQDVLRRQIAEWEAEIQRLAELVAAATEGRIVYARSNETTWKKEPAIEGKHGGCLNCGHRTS